MSSSDPRIDARLKAFLDDKEQEKANDYTLPNLFLAVNQIANNINEVSQEVRLLKQRVDRHGRNIAQIKQHIELEPDSGFDSGLHLVEDLKREIAKKDAELKEQHEDHLWWKRSAVKWIVAGIAWIATTFAAALISSMWSHK